MFFSLSPLHAVPAGHALVRAQAVRTVSCTDRNTRSIQLCSCRTSVGVGWSCHVLFPCSRALPCAILRYLAPFGVKILAFPSVPGLRRGSLAFPFSSFLQRLPTL